MDRYGNAIYLTPDGARHAGVDIAASLAPAWASGPANAHPMHDAFCMLPERIRSANDATQTGLAVGGNRRRPAPSASETAGREEGASENSCADRCRFARLDNLIHHRRTLLCGAGDETSL